MVECFRILLSFVLLCVSDVDFWVSGAGDEEDCLAALSDGLDVTTHRKQCNHTAAGTLCALPGINK